MMNRQPPESISHTRVQAVTDHIQPVVLTGGRSRRFGRDKLVERVNGEFLASVPIKTLRSVFGPRVAIVGMCDARLARLADVVIDDPYPGMGPVGGICAALEHACGDIFLCAGDLLSIEVQAVKAILAASIQNPDYLAYVACDDAGRMHPAFGLYRASCSPIFARAVALSHLKLSCVLEPGMVARVPIANRALRNINRRDDLDRSCQGGD